MATTIEHTKGEPISTAAEVASPSRAPVPESKTSNINDPNAGENAKIKQQELLPLFQQISAKANAVKVSHVS